ncbi:MAG: T9SS type A sorting domain-containing protein [Candidatus Komeilibacteria bacterium]
MKRIATLIVVVLGMFSLTFGQITLTYADENLNYSPTVPAGTNNLNALSIDIEYYGQTIMADMTYEFVGINGIDGYLFDVTLLDAHNEVEYTNGVWEEGSASVTFLDVYIPNGITTFTLLYDVPYYVASGNVIWTNLNLMTFCDLSGLLIPMETVGPNDCSNLVCGSAITIGFTPAIAYIYNFDFEDEVFLPTVETIEVWNGVLHFEGSDFQSGIIWLHLDVENAGFGMNNWWNGITLYVAENQCPVSGINDMMGNFYFNTNECPILEEGDLYHPLRAEVSLNPENFPNDLGSDDHLSFTASLLEADDIQMTSTSYGWDMQVVYTDGDYPITAGTKTIAWPNEEPIETLEVELVSSNTEFVNWNDDEVLVLEDVVSFAITNNHPFAVSLDNAEFHHPYYEDYDLESLEVYFDGVLYAVATGGLGQWTILDPNYILGAGQTVIMSVNLGAWGNGYGGMYLYDIIYYSLDGEAFMLDNFGGVEFRVVSPNEQMYNMWAESENDTLYIFPGQHLTYDYHFNEEWYNSFQDVVMGLTCGISTGNVDSWSYLPNWQKDYFENDGTLTIFEEGRALSYAWTSGSDQGINSAMLGYISYDNASNYGYDQYLSGWVSLYLYHPLFGYRAEYHNLWQTVITNPGVSGDLSGDNIVDWNDYELLVYAFGPGNDVWDSYYNPAGEINASRVSFVMDWASMYDAWLLNIWLENPDNYMVANLCIGEEFTYEGCQGVEDRAVEYVINNNSIELTTDGNIVGVLGTLPDGERWSTVVQLTDEGLLSWSDDNESIEPVVLQNQITRGGTITLNLPEGLQIERVEAKQFNQYLLGDLNDDGVLNIVDVLLMVDHVVAGTYIDIADMDSNGLLNIVDIVMLVGEILGLGRECDIPSQASVSLANDHFNLTADGSIAGIQFSATGDFQISPASIPQGWQLSQGNGMVVLFSLDGDELSGDNSFSYSGECEIDEIMVVDWNGNTVPVTMTVPTEYNLSLAYPNPFNPVTTLSYSLSEDEHLQITVYDMLGREVAELVSGFQTAGNYQVSWNAEHEASGIYLVKMTTNTFQSTQKVMLVK